MVNKSEDLIGVEESLSNIEIKDKPEWLTEELFREFLHQDFPSFKQVNKFLIKPAVAAGENYMTLMLRVTFEVELFDYSTKSTSYMVKIKPSPEKLQIMIKEWQIFMKEYTTYTKYIPKFEEYYRKAGKQVKLAPRILEPRKVKVNDDLLILEDLRRKGFKNFDRHLGLDMTHTKAVLNKLAKFHAASALYAELESPFPSMYDQCLSCDKDLFEDHRLKISKIFREHLHLYGDVQYLEEKLKTYAETKFDPFQMKSEKNPNEFNVLNHGDLWVNNIMFQYNEEGALTDTYFIDFQMGRYGSPAQDLIYFLFSSTNLEIKLQHFDYFISYYHRELTENLMLINYQGNVPKLRDIHTALFKHDYWAYTTISALMPIVLCESRDDANVDNLMSEDGEEFRRAMYSNRHYGKSMENLVTWLDRRGTFDL